MYDLLRSLVVGRAGWCSVGNKFLVLVDIIQQSICDCLKLSEGRRIRFRLFPGGFVGGVGFAEEVVQHNFEAAVKGGGSQCLRCADLIIVALLLRSFLLGLREADFVGLFLFIGGGVRRFVGERRPLLGSFGNGRSGAVAFYSNSVCR